MKLPHSRRHLSRPPTPRPWGLPPHRGLTALSSHLFHDPGLLHLLQTIPEMAHFSHSSSFPLYRNRAFPQALSVRSPSRPVFSRPLFRPRHGGNVGAVAVPGGLWAWRPRSARGRPVPGDLAAPPHRLWPLGRPCPFALGACFQGCPHT